MIKKFQNIRGMNDILPSQISLWQSVEKTLKDIAHAYNFTEIRLPILENAKLFTATLGQTTDIVTKEMYTFTDKGGENLSLRPEGTAGVVRSVIQNNLLGKITKIWYLGQMFRYERPQKGRYRSFYQFGMEYFGSLSPLSDVEILALTKRFWDALNLQNAVVLHINNIGFKECREKYKVALQNYFRQFTNRLSDELKIKLEHNPLRILDSKDPDIQDLIEGAPLLADYLSPEAQEHFAVVKKHLDHLGISYIENSHLVRGLDYYDLTVFEWRTNKLGSQDAICAGGRYDKLVSMFGGNDTPALGFAIGMERLIALLELQNSASTAIDDLSCYFMISPKNSFYGMKMAETLHDNLPNWQIITDYEDSSLKNKFKKANRSLARWAIIIDENEEQKNGVTLKDLRQNIPQEFLTISDLITKLKG